MEKRQVTPADSFAGKRLRAARQGKDVTLEQLGKHIGVSAQQVRKYEVGQNRMSVGVLVEAASFLEVPVDFFFEGAR